MRSIRRVGPLSSPNTVRPSALKRNKETNIVKKELLFNRETILARISDLAREISSDYADIRPLLIGILNGCVFFFADLAMKITIPAEVDFLRAASYGSGTSSSGTVRFTKDVEIPVRGKHVILIEDIVDTGLTLRQIVESLEERGTESIRICALIDKLERREVAVSIDYRGFQVKEGFLIGYGMDCNEQYRTLPDIYALK